MSRIFDVFSDVEGIKFFTKTEDKLQIGIMERPKGYKVKPHYHNDTEEVLYVVYGSLRVIIDSVEYWVGKEDVIHLTKGIHEVEFLEDSRVLEIKQGPYRDDKVYV